MVIVYKGREYPVRTDECQLAEDIEAVLPLTMKMRKNGDAEYTGTLPVHPKNDGRKITHTEVNGIYYYEGWNCLCLNYTANDISPWYVNRVGDVEDPGFSDALKQDGDTITVTIR